MCERNINQLLLTCPQPGTWLTIQAWALIGDRTSDPLVRRPALRPLSHTSWCHGDSFEMFCIGVWHILPAFTVNVNSAGKIKWGRKNVSICSVVSALKQVNSWPLMYFSLGHVSFLTGVNVADYLGLYYSRLPCGSPVDIHSPAVLRSVKVWCYIAEGRSGAAQKKGDGRKSNNYRHP